MRAVLTRNMMQPAQPSHAQRERRLVRAHEYLYGKALPTAKYLLHRLYPDRLRLKGKRTVRVDGITAALHIHLDAHGIPHIQAANEPDAFFGLGYMHGRDRRFQIELFKLMAQGRLAELLGGGDSDAKLFGQDLFNRALGFAEDGRRIYEEAPAHGRGVLEAYSAGINCATATERMPVEFQLLGTRPERWRAEDSAAVMAWFSFGLCKNWELELARLELLLHQLAKGHTVERALSIWRPRYELPPHLIDFAGENTSFDSIPVIADELVEYLRKVAAGHNGGAGHEGELSSPASSTCSLGSNVWAVGGRWTGTNKGALAADPHLPFMMPSSGYLAHLECAAGERTLRVIGAGFPGIPAFLFGTNGEVAWGVAANWVDVTDLYVELPVENAPATYRAGAGTLPFDIRQETFYGRTRSGAVTEHVRSMRFTQHGPLLNDLLPELGPDFPLVALKREREMGKPLDSLRSLYLSKDAKQAGAALRSFYAMPGHWAVSDSSGNVAYHSTARFPVRRRHLGTVPVPGWTGTYEWEEMVSSDALPASENPTQDFVAAANNQVIHPMALSYPHNFEGDVPFRYMRLEERLGRGNDGSPVLEQMRQLHLEAVDLGCASVLRLWSGALEPLQQDPEPLVSGAARLLLSWRGEHCPDHPAPTIFNALCVSLLRYLLEDEMPARTLAFVCTYFNIEPFIYDIIGNFNNPVWESRGGVVDTIRSRFHQTVRQLAAEYGPDVKAWAWTRSAPFVIKHPLGSVKALAPYLNRGPLPTSGSHNSLFKHYTRRDSSVSFPVVLGPALRVTIDLANLAGSTMSVAGGQSGRPASPHYDDLLPLYLEGRGASMEMDMTRIASGAEGVLLLKPSGK